MSYSSSVMEVFNLSDETTEINIDKYLVPRLYIVVIVADETVYKLLSESLKELLTRLQRGDIFTQSKIQELRGGRFINAEKNTKKIRKKFLAALSHRRLIMIASCA